MVLAGNMAATMKCCEQAMILAREMAALSVSVIPLYVLLQRFCTVMSSCHLSISCGENAVSVSAWCTASHRREMHNRLFVFFSSNDPCTKLQEKWLP